MKTFRKLLSEKLSTKSSSKFEKNFWQKFDQEFSEKKTIRFFDLMHSWIALGGLGAAALLLILVRFENSGSFESMELARNGNIEMLASIDMLQEYELLKDLTDISQLPEQDEEWEILTGEKT